MIECNSKLDGRMLAGVKCGWWVYCGVWFVIGYHSPDGDWYGQSQKGTIRLSDEFIDYGFGEQITAIHRPTDAPDLAGAYMLGQSDSVSRAEAEKMVGSGHKATLIGTQWCTASTMLGGETHIASEGGNVWAIEGSKP